MRLQVQRFVILRGGEFVALKEKPPPGTSQEAEAALEVLRLNLSSLVSVDKRTKQGKLRSQKELFRFVIRMKDNSSSDWACLSEEDRATWMDQIAQIGALEQAGALGEPSNQCRCSLKGWFRGGSRTDA